MWVVYDTSVAKKGHKIRRMLQYYRSACTKHGNYFKWIWTSLREHMWMLKWGRIRILTFYKFCISTSILKLKRTIFSFTIIDSMTRFPSIGPKYVWVEASTHNRVTYLTTPCPTNGDLRLSLLDPYRPSIWAHKNEEYRLQNMNFGSHKALTMPLNYARRVATLMWTLLSKSPSPWPTSKF